MNATKSTSTTNNIIDSEEGQYFDWFKSYDAIRDIFTAEIARSSRILMLGCGNSRLSEDMYADGYHNILNVDFSEIVISQMSTRCQNMPEMEWQVMNVQNMEGLANESVDVAIDKGTMDALMCEKGDVWSPSEQLIKDVKMEVDEVLRVLKPGGKFIYITFGQPHFRLRHLERSEWTVETLKIGDAFHYFVYIMKKQLLR